MKSMQNRFQNRNLTYLNCADHRISNNTSNNNQVPQQSFLLNSDGRNIQNSTTSNHLAYLPSAGGFRQSLSGSETDLSTSTENLTHEEKYVLQNSTRQEPQGEETLDKEEIGGGGGFSDSGGGGVGTFRGGGSSYASMDQSSCNTLIIHRDCDGDFEDDYEDDDEDESCNQQVTDTRQKCGAGLQNRNVVVCNTEMRPESHHHTAANYYASQMPYYHNCQLAQKQQPFMYIGQNSFENNPYLQCNVSAAVSPAQLPKEITGIPKHYLDQSEVLKHLAKEMKSPAAASTAPSVPTVSVSSMAANSFNKDGFVSGVHPTVSQAFFGAEFDLSKLPPPPKYPGMQNNAANPENSTMTTPVTTDSSAASSPIGLKESAQIASKSSNSGPPTSSCRPATSNRAALSRSQPDLTQIDRWDEIGNRRNHYMSQRPRTKGKASPEMPPALVHQRAQNAKYGHIFSSDVLLMSKHIEKIEAENKQLKYDLEMYTSKVSKLQKFEVDIQKVQTAYEDLVKSSHKREKLNQAIRTKLELEICRLQEQSKDLKAQLDAANNLLHRRFSPLDFDGNSDAKREMLLRDQLTIAQLVQQNKELTATKERYEIELAAQRATLQEQRTHIEILDTALTNAQVNVVRFEEECRKKQAYVERVAQLQKALTALQEASERREQMEHKLRKQLEKDLHELRQQQSSQQSGGDGGRSKPFKTAGGSQSGSNSGNRGDSDAGGKNGDLDGGLPSGETMDDMKRAIREKEERIIALETEVSKWEQRYLEENAMRQIAIDAASMPKDAKIAALERTSLESEKMIAQARSEKLKQMDELHASNKRCADMESRIKDLESHLAERDAMIKVLQKQSMEKDVFIQNAMKRSPRHTPHSSILMDNNSGGSPTTSGSGIRANSLSTMSVETTDPSGLLNGASSSNLPMGVTPGMEAVGKNTTESLDEQLKKLDSQLLSKDSIIHALRNEKEKYPNHYWMV